MMRSRFRSLRNTYGNSDLKHTPVDFAQAERNTQAGIAVARAEEEQSRSRIEHPVITEPKWTTDYRVQRRVRTRDGYSLELIGEMRSLGEALTIARKEAWAAIVTDKGGKQVHFNFQPELHRA